MVNRKLSSGLGFVLAALISTALAAPVSAAEVLSESGQRGIYILPDQVDDQNNYQGAKCGYGAENASGEASFKWMKFTKPDVYARDTGAGAQTQNVTLVYRLQRNTSTGWKTMATSTQTRSAHETDPADFVDRKLYYSARAGNLLRGTVEIKWLRSGNVEGKVKLRIEFYSVKWTVGTPDYVFEDACTGLAD